MDIWHALMALLAIGTPLVAAWAVLSWIDRRKKASAARRQRPDPSV